MDIAIIGLAGIGAAHAVAAVRAGHTVKWVMDIDTRLDTRARYGGTTIRNTWGTIDECAEWVPPTYHVHDACTYLPIVEKVDLLIIAVPNNLHQPVLAAWLPYVPKVLIEKPAVIFPTALDERIVVNYEYTQHPANSDLLPAAPPHTMQFSHNGLVPQIRGVNVLPKDDLAPHCLSVLARWFDLKTAKLHVLEDTVYRYSAVLMQGAKNTVISCAYLPPGPETICNFSLLFAGRKAVHLDWDDHMMAKMYDAPSNIQLNHQINHLLYPVLK